MSALERRLTKLEEALVPPAVQPFCLLVEPPTDAAPEVWGQHRRQIDEAKEELARPAGGAAANGPGVPALWRSDTAAVADEGQRELQVLQVCLAEIERSRPFLIGLIGERYGWIPPPERMQAAAEAGFSGEVVGRSVTELEMAYGVLEG